jgi:hypothetical protein
MTAAKTPSQRGTSNRRRGHQAERDLCNWLRRNGFPHAERAVRTGFRIGDRVSADPGDITGTPGIVWSVKDCAVERTDQWFVELAAMKAPASSEIGLLVVKRRGHADPHRWWCWTWLEEIAGPAPGGLGLGRWFPIRAELGHVIPLLRAAGYGTPIGETA